MTRALKFGGVILTLVLFLSSCSSDNVSLHSHSYFSWEIIKQPTCTEDGVLQRECSCGHTEQTSVSALDHAYDEGEIIKAPTCTERGQINYTCKLCGDVKMTIANKASHTKSSYYIIETEYHAKECTVCLKVLDKEDHYYYDDVCIVCGKTHEQTQPDSETE